MAEKSRADRLRTLLDGRAYRVVFYLALLGYLVSQLLIAQDYRWQDKLFPMVVGLPLIALLLLQLVLTVKPELRDRFVVAPPTAPAEETDRGTPTAELRSELVVLGWTIALPVLVYFVGFVYGLPIYIFAFITWFTGDTRKAVATVVLFMVFGYLLFVEFLSIRIYDGVLPLPDLIDLL